MSSVPLWAIGLVIAGIAPFVVRAIGDAFEARARKRTERAIDDDAPKPPSS